jgi:hypothetical protein
MKTMLLILAATAVLQWLVIAGIAIATRETFPKKGMRRAELMLLASTAILAMAWLAQIDYLSLWQGTTPTASASAVAPSRGSCATIESGMTLEQVKNRMGEPDRTKPDEETRGPGAVTLSYDGSRCSVHVFDEKVEFVD